MDLLDIIYPKFCLGCGTFGTYCCSSCMKDIPRLSLLKCPECEKPTIDGNTHLRCQTPFGIDGVISFYPYGGIVKKAIKGIKYRFAFRIITDLFQLLPEKALSVLKQLGVHNKHNTFLVPIPLHASRLRMRGFNQAETIADSLSVLLSLPVQKNVLERVRKTPPQVEMKRREDRVENMKHVFSIKNDEDLPLHGASILLVDDVFTTGSTLKSAAHVLKQAGARHVFGVTIAQ